MKIETYIDSLVSYAMNHGLAEPVDHQVLPPRRLDRRGTDASEPSQDLHRAGRAGCRAGPGCLPRAVHPSPGRRGNDRGSLREKQNEV